MTEVLVIVDVKTSAGISELSASIFEHHYQRSLLEVLTDLITFLY
jgi:hypothetical protein